MESTSISLLRRLRQPGDREAWERMVDLYTPLLYFWACRLDLQPQDAADLVQDVFATLLRELPQFRYDRRQSFRGWLRTITHNRYRDLRRRRAADPLRAGDRALADVAVPGAADVVWEAEYHKHLVGQALTIMRAEFQPSTWRACWSVVVDGRPAAEVAAELGLTVDAVYAAKYRVLRRLRQELEGLLE